MKIVFTEQVEAEQVRLGVNLRSSIEDAIACVPGADLVELSRVVIADFPEGRRKEKKIRGSYFPKYKKLLAHIELYVGIIFGPIERPIDFKLMRAIWELELAQTLFHEIGHHVREIRSHGIKVKEEEDFAEKYAREMIDKYYPKKRPSIEECFDKLEQMATNGGADAETVRSMRVSWERDLDELIKGQNLSD